MLKWGNIYRKNAEAEAWKGGNGLGKFNCSNEETVAVTAQGKIRGYLYEGVYAFQGIKYADAQRFQMPKETESWEGVKDALAYGYVCPLLNQDEPFEDVRAPHRYWPMDENCQYLNIWTTSLDADAAKPVMVWLHGGGFAAGSSIEQIAYEGDHLAQAEDVVVVSLNHRLNILGYLDLSAYGEKYANSGNAGNVDIVMALRWIQKNIKAFGGDPGNVTLFGQSGGGMKVWTLMNTPAADGLFHKGIIQSGVIDDFMEEKQDARPVVSALLSELGLKEEDVEALEKVPYSRLAQAYNQVAPRLKAQGLYVGGTPVANGWYLGDPRKVGFSEHAKTIPVLIGSVLAEFTSGRIGTEEGDRSEEGMMRMLEKKYGAHAFRLKELLNKAYPGKPLSWLPALDPFIRIPTKDFIEKMAQEASAPVYSYLFSLDLPFDGLNPAWHCAEIPFVFHNIDRVPVCCIPGVSEKLQEQICVAWAHFARYGTPGTDRLPDWPACRPGKEMTMILDQVCDVRENHDAQLLEAILKTSPRNPLLPAPEGVEQDVILH